MPPSTFAPSVTLISPNSGPVSGGTAVTISGDDFVNGCRVKFGGVDSAQVTFNNSNQLTAVTPAQTAPGPVNVRIINPDGQLNVLQDAFQYTQPPPTPSPGISFIAPVSGPVSGGTQVTITGENFASGCRVKFGGVDSAQVIFINSNQIIATTSAQPAPGPATVRVVNPDGQANALQNAFQYQQPPPTPAPSIFSVNPNSGPLAGGTSVIINGQNFAAGCVVRFGGVDAAQVAFNGSNQLIAVAPPQSSPGPVNVRVVNPDGQANALQNAFQYQQSPPTPAPGIASVSPNSGPLAGGTSVIISGQNFAAGCVVRFGGVDASQVIFNSSNQLTALTPPQTSPGPVNVRVVNPDGQPGVLNNAFQYQQPPPVPMPSIFSLTPNSGPPAGGVTVVISGQNFAPGCSVKFGGIDALQVGFISSGQINATAPPQSAPGPVNVRVINPNGQAGISPNAFQYILSPAPSIASVSPNSGPVSGGTPVTIFGQNFAAGCVVRFGGVDAAQVTFNNSSQVTAIAPPQSAAGSVNVRLVNPDGQAVVKQSAFQYTQPAPAPAPAVISISPTSGPLSGGTAVTVNGQNFASGCVVRFGGVDSPQVTFNSSTRVTAVTPPQSAGTVSVRVINPDGQANALQNAFQYQQPPPTPAPSVSSVSPNSGSISGGTQVTISGQNFAAGCVVRFGGTDSPQVTFISSSQITAVSPAQSAAGPVNVRVINPDGQANALQNAFQYVQQPPPTPAPGIASVSPNSGPLAGGASVIINGQNFASGCKVKFGTVDAPQATFNNSNQIATVAPPQSAASTVDVKVTNPDGKAGVLSGAFRYVAPAPEPVKVQVTAPNGGETVKAGTPLNIKWTSSGATEHRVEYALDGSATFNSIATGLAGTAQNFTWNIPADIVPVGKPQAQAKIRIVARNSATAQEALDTGNGPFTITSAAVMTMEPVRNQNKISPQAGNCTTTAVASIAAGQTARYCEGVVVQDQFGNLISDVQVGLVLNVLGTRPAGVTTAIVPNPVRTCKPGEEIACSDYIVTLQTTTNVTAPGIYEYGVVASCAICSFSRTIVVLNLTVEQPKLKVTVTPNTPNRREITAGEKAEYNLTIEKSSYLGPIEITVEGDFDETITPKPVQIKGNTNADGKFTGKLVLETQRPEAEKTLGTPPREYNLKTKVVTPDNAVVTAADLKLKVSIAPDIDIAVSEQTKTVKVEPGKKAVFTLFLFRYNFEESQGPVELSVTGQPPSPNKPQFVEVPNSAKPLPGKIGKRITYTATIDVPANVEPKQYNLKFIATAKVNKEKPPVSKTDDATLNIKVKQIKITPDRKEQTVGLNENVKFFVSIEPRTIDLVFFTQVVSSPVGGVGGELQLPVLYDVFPVRTDKKMVTLMVGTKPDSTPGDYVFKLGAKQEGGSADPVTNTPQLKVTVTGAPEVRLSVTSKSRSGSFGNNPVFVIKVKRLNYMGPLNLGTRRLAKEVGKARFGPEVPSPDDPTESTVRMEVEIARNPLTGTVFFDVFSKVDGILKNEIDNLQIDVT